MKHSPVILLTNALRERDLALQECPHWDHEGGPEGDLCDCCYRVAEARRAVKKLRPKGT